MTPLWINRGPLAVEKLAGESRASRITSAPMVRRKICTTSQQIG
jgi:hypothetical protein